MVRKRLDDRVRALIEQSVSLHQRGMIVLVGDHGKDQIPNIYQILSKCSLQVAHQGASTSSTTATTTITGTSTARQRGGKTNRLTVATITLTLTIQG